MADLQETKPGFFAGLGRALLERVILSYKSTLLGLLVSGALEAINYTLVTVPDPRLHALAGIVLPLFLAWRDKKVKDGSIKLLALFLVFTPIAARAQGSPSARTAVAVQAVGTDEPPPPELVPAPPPSGQTIGGCFSSGRFCVAPTVALSLAAINLSKKSVEGAFSPGAGLGLTYNRGQWYSTGVGFFLNLDPGAQNASLAVIVSLLNGYARVGWGKGFIGDVSSRLLFGTGIDL